MNAPLPVVLAAALLSAAIATMPADAAPRKKNTRALAAIPAQPPTDRFLACDVRVRDYLREGGAAIRVTKIEVDDARLQLNIHHEYGEAGKSSRKYLRGGCEGRSGWSRLVCDRCSQGHAGAPRRFGREHESVDGHCPRGFRGKMQTHHVLSVCRSEQARS